MNSLSPVGIPASRDFIAAGLEPSNVLPAVIMRYPQLNPVTAISTKVSGTPEITNQYNVIRYSLGNLNEALQIKSISLVSGSIFATITFINSNAQPYRIGDVVQDDITNTTAQVMDNTNPGTLLLKFLGSRTSGTTFTASDFIAGHYTRFIGTITDPTGNAGRETRNWTPTPTTWAIQKFSDVCKLYEYDMNNHTYLDEKNTKGEPYMMYLKVNTWMSQLKTQLERMVVGNNLSLGDPITGTGCQAAGLEYQIQNGGGYYQSLSALPTEADYQNYIEAMIDVNGSNSKEITFFGGSRALGNFQSVTGVKYVLYPGQENTFGGQSIKGIDVKTYDYMGVTLRWISYDLYNDRSWSATPSTISGMNGKGMGQGNILAINTANSFTPSGAFEPFVKRHAYGKSSIIDTMQYVSGLYDVNGQPAANPTNLEFAATYVYNTSFFYELTNPQLHGLLRIAS